MNVFKMMGALKDLPKIQEEMKANAERLAAERFSAGDALVQVEADGAMRLTAVRIAEAGRTAPDLEERLLVAANNALGLAKQRVAEVTQKQMQERFGDLPGMDGMMKGLLSG